MGALQERMREGLELRGCRPNTVATYLGCARRYAAHFGRSPAELGAEEVRTFLVHLMRERRLSWSSQRVYVAALRALYTEALGRSEDVHWLRSPKGLSLLETPTTTESWGFLPAAVVGKPPMFSILRKLARAFWSAFTDRCGLAARNVALEHQLDVITRPTRSRPRPKLKLRDRILWVWLSRIWSGWKNSIRIVRPETVIAWHRRGWRLYWTWRSKRRKPGRPPVPQDVRDLIRKMSSENPWGATRLHGEILKLGIDVSQATVAKYMVRHDKPPSQNWRTFLDNHVATLASIDFFTVPTVRFGVLYIFLVLAHDRRTIRHFNVTSNPTAEWTARQITEAFPEDSGPRYMIRDRDGVYGDIFRGRVKAMGIKEVLIAPRSPWQSPYVERMIGTLRRDLLDHVVVIDEKHLRRLVREYLDGYYHPARTHLSLGKDAPIPRPVQPPEMGKVISIPVLGGLHHRYLRRAA